MKPWWLIITFLMVILLPVGGAANAQQAEYQIGAGDNIRISVFQNPDLTLDTRVSENGTISYPLIGVVTIGGLTLLAAEQVIARALRDGNFIQQPQVSIVLTQNRGNQVSVLGLVARPGRFPLETVNTRLSEMVAIAGGIIPTGADVVILTGTRGGKPLRMEVDIVGMFLSGDLKNDVVVAGGDVIYVHRQPIYYIYGEAARAGSNRVERNMTFRQALATAGGPTARGTERGLYVYRRGADGRVQIVRPDLAELVQADDVIYVRESLF